MNKPTLEAAAGVYSGTAHDAKPHPMHIERNKAFKAGAEWQRNHVWHKNTEMPSDGVNKDGIGKPCMVQEGSRVFLCHACRTTIGKYYFTDHLRTWHPVENVDCWAYLDDLMPTSFDEILEENKDVLQRLKKGEVK